MWPSLYFWHKRHPILLYLHEYDYKGHDLEQELLHSSIVSRILSLTYYTLLIIIIAHFYVFTCCSCHMQTSCCKRLWAWIHIIIMLLASTHTHTHTHTYTLTHTHTCITSTYCPFYWTQIGASLPFSCRCIYAVPISPMYTHMYMQLRKGAAY